ncbi:hypothetical protein ABIB75_001541 [Bradyrhizobium sp. GM2.2]
MRAPQSLWGAHCKQMFARGRTTTVTKLEHARTLKEMKMPLNTPVEERTFSTE